MWAKEWGHIFIQIYNLCLISMTKIWWFDDKLTGYGSECEQKVGGGVPTCKCDYIGTFPERVG